MRQLDPDTASAMAVPRWLSMTMLAVALVGCRLPASSDSTWLGQATGTSRPSARDYAETVAADERSRANNPSSPGTTPASNPTQTQASDHAIANGEQPSSLDEMVPPINRAAVGGPLSSGIRLVAFQDGGLSGGGVGGASGELGGGTSGTGNTDTGGSGIQGSAGGIGSGGGTGTGGSGLTELGGTDPLGTRPGEGRPDRIEGADRGLGAEALPGRSRGDLNLGTGGDGSFRDPLRSGLGSGPGGRGVTGGGLGAASPAGSANGQTEGGAGGPGTAGTAQTRQPRDIGRPGSGLEGDIPGVEELPLPDRLVSRPDGPPPAEGTTLSLSDVLASVLSNYPLLYAASRERDIAAGNLTSAWGNFDTKLRAEAVEKVLGFYRNYRQSVGLVQPMWNGSDVYAGYRIGRGEFEPWYKERETNKGGEFRLGTTIPLLQDRHFDQRRLDVLLGELEIASAEPRIHAERLDYLRNASYAYWNWVAAGQAYRVAQSQIELANEQQQALEIRLSRGDVAPLELVDNRRVIAGREARLTVAEQRLAQAAVRLALFYRTPAGEPWVPSVDALPPVFPDEVVIDRTALPLEIEAAVRNRPELITLGLQRQAAEAELTQAENQELPALDAFLVASKDVGEPASTINDKGPFELETGLEFAWDLQRRKALGKQRALRGKIAQIAAKQKFAQDRIFADVEQAFIALEAAWTLIEQNERIVDAAERLAEAERRSIDVGLSNILVLNLREQAVADANLGLIEARTAYRMAEADLRAAVGLATDAPPLQTPIPSSAPRSDRRRDSDRP